MSKPMIRIHNTETDEVIDREMTDTEFAKYKADQIIELAKQAEVAAKATAKADLLKKLGINAEEAALLLS